MENKKNIFGLTKEQEKALTDYAKANNKTKTDIIRMFCDALIGIEHSQTNIVIHDCNTVKMLLSSDNKLRIIKSEDSDITRLDAKIVYEQGKPFTSNYMVSRADIINFGGAK